MNLKRCVKAKENLKNDKKLFLEQTKELLTLIGQNDELRSVFNQEASKYSYLFEDYGIKLSNETLDSTTKKKLLGGK